ncbi:MAG: glycosyltransferase family 2 protein [Cyanobacteria bacterium P01_H01_bin.105]
MLTKLKRLLKILKTEGFLSVVQQIRLKVSSPRYDQWIKQTEREFIDGFAKDSSILDNSGPLISILLPVYNVESIWLTKAIESVLAQQYPHWQLCIADDASTVQAIRPLLERYSQRDPRIDVVFCSQNGGISAATNAALERANGDFIALLDHDDELAPNALYEVTRHLQVYPDTDFIYTDEDQITQKGKRKNPFFKPDWSLDYFHGCMYTCHLGVYRTSLIREIGGFRSQYDGAQDWDLVLRLTEKTNRIHHIPKILYHWRTLPTSAASGAQAKPWAYAAAERALQSAVDRSPYPGTVKPLPGKPGFFRVRRHIQDTPLVSIIIPSAGTRLDIKGTSICLLEQCLASIRHLSTYPNYEIILVDGYDIPEATLQPIQGPDLTLVRCDQPFNFSQRMNLGTQAAQGDILLLLNDDTEVITPDWIEAMVELAQQKDIGAVGAKLFYPNGRLQHAGMVILAGNPSHAFHNGNGSHDGYHCSNIVNRNYLGVTGACLMMRQDVFTALGGFDESFPLNYNDVDLCLRIHEAGYRNVYTPHAELIHYESVSRMSELKPGELERLHAKFAHTRYMVDDPYYNPNLSVRRPFFQLAWPSERQNRLKTR